MGDWAERREAPVSLGVVSVLTATDIALKFRSRDFGDKWCPLSVIHDDSEVFEGAGKGDSGELVVKAWFAEKSGWSG